MRHLLMPVDTPVKKCSELALLDCSCRTGTSTGSAVYTCACIDLEFAVACRDSAYWTFSLTSSTAHTRISDHVCHWSIPPYVFS